MEYKDEIAKIDKAIKVIRDGLVDAVDHGITVEDTIRLMGWPRATIDAIVAEINS